ncbi:hypothetical protein [Sphingobium sp. Leaf26]|uniref:hypothetical protein n=1 Tax=Sphingobium sp. Leaf26 TaxID=1735693 RepID=UPI0012E31A39|nr:hypothetical protein [Sphingobium sp. Leaf26]
MTYHDRSLLEGQRAKLKKRAKLRHDILQGSFSFTLFPKSPRFQSGSIEGDWKAVGADFRKAMKQYENRD